MWKALKPFLNTKLLIVIFLGLLIRFIFIPQPGFVADVSFWKSWALAALDKGALWTFENTNYNYAPTFIYFLKSLTFVYRLFADPHQFYKYWEVHNFFFLLILKIPLIITDTLTALIIFYFVRQTTSQKNSSLPLIAASFYYLNPVIIFKGVYWGQVGSLSAFLTSLVLVLIFNQKNLSLPRLIIAGLLIPLTVLIKLQYVIFMPLILLFLFLNHGHKKTVLTLASACFSFFLINLPFFLIHKFSTAIKLVFASASYFPYLSLNAYNFWWLVNKGAYFTSTHDATPFFNLGSAKSTGLLLFAVVYLAAILLILKEKSQKNLLLSLILASFGFFMFPTEMHERYIYPIFIFLSLAFPYFANYRLGFSKLLVKHQQRWEPVLKSIGLLKYAHGRRGEPTKFCEASLASADEHGSLKTPFRERIEAESKFLVGNLNAFLIFCSIISILAFYNLHNVLYQNYPENSLPLLDKLDITNLTLAVSAINLFLFLLLFLLVITRLKNFAPIPIVILTLLLSIKYYQNNKQTISLTQIPNTYGTQGFGNLGLNIPVSSTFSPTNQSFLSTNYFFYRQGFGTHAPSRLIFPLQGRYRRFTTDVGVDTQAGEQASVIFQVFADSQRLLYDSGVIKKEDFPKHVDVSVEGVKNLDLIITDAGDGKTDDHANWLNPTIYK